MTATKIILGKKYFYLVKISICAPHFYFSIFHSLLTSWKITNNIYLPHDFPSSSRMRRGLVLQSQTALPSVFVVQPSSQPFASHGSGSPKSLKINWAFYHTVYVTFRVKFTESLLSKNKTILIRKSTSKTESKKSLTTFVLAFDRWTMFVQIRLFQIARKNFLYKNLSKYISWYWKLILKVWFQKVFPV